MSLERVYFVPGLAESVLDVPTVLTSSTLNPVYPNVSEFLLGGFGKMRLAPNGIDPGPPDGISLVANNVLGPYCLWPTLQLAVIAENSSYNFLTHAWDWRKSTLVAGDLLATRILSEVPAGEQCSIVAHSAGGLVARRAWSHLLGIGEQSRIRRIVAIGSPHYGSYFVAYAWSGGSTFLKTLWEWNQWAGQTILGIQLVTGWTSWTLNEVIALSMTWPALYECLPVLNAPDASNDPNRSAVFTASNWVGDVKPSQLLLDNCKNVYQPWALSAASQPPNDVLICVGGYANGTPQILEDPSKLGTLGATSYTNDGDGIVTSASALLTGSTTWLISSDHASQYPDSVNNGNVVAWLDQVIIPTPTPPPAVVDASTNTVGLTDPPGTPVFHAQPGVYVYTGRCVNFSP